MVHLLKHYLRVCLFSSMYNKLSHPTGERTSSWVASISGRAGVGPVKINISISNFIITAPNFWYFFILCLPCIMFVHLTAREYTVCGLLIICKHDFLFSVVFFFSFFDVARLVVFHNVNWRGGCIYAANLFEILR